MSTISVTLPADGQTADAADYNVPINTIVSAINGGIDSNNITAGGVVPNSLTSGTGTSWAYVTWTPTLTNGTVGNGSVSLSYYTQIGKTVFFRFLFSLGSTSAVGTNLTFTLPVTASSNVTLQHIIATGYLQDTATANYHCTGWLNSTTTCLVLLHVASGTYTSLVGTSSTTPFTWGNTDAILLQGNYEAA